ncbi:MAG: hypothetical protein V1644_00085 [Candidatus Micrarchaeota archaeon]
MKFLDVISKNKITAVFIILAAIWFITRHALIQLFCQGTQTCWLYPDSWPTLLGITPSSPTIWVGLLAAILFALPFGRASLLATLVGIHLAQPVFGLAGVTLIFVVSSIISVLLVHTIVEHGLRHPKAAWIHLRLKPIQSIFAPFIRKNGILWLAIGNLVGSQWHMSALGIICKVPRKNIWLGLLLGNLAGFILLYAFSQVPNLDAISTVFLVLALALALASPALLAKWTNNKKSK